MTYLYWTNGGRYIEHERPGAPVARVRGHELGILRPCRRRARCSTIMSARWSDAPQQRDRPALPRRSGDHGLAARQRAAARRKRRSRASAHARLSRVDRRHRAADQVDRPEPHGLDRKRGHAGLHRRRAMRRRRAPLAGDRLRHRAHLAAELELGRPEGPCRNLADRRAQHA